VRAPFVVAVDCAVFVALVVVFVVVVVVAAESCQ
jgi:hypothetical protein